MSRIPDLGWVDWQDTSVEMFTTPWLPFPPLQTNLSLGNGQFILRLWHWMTKLGWWYRWSVGGWYQASRNSLERKDLRDWNMRILPVNISQKKQCTVRLTQLQTMRHRHPLQPLVQNDTPSSYKSAYKPTQVIPSRVLCLTPGTQLPRSWQLPWQLTSPGSAARGSQHILWSDHLAAVAATQGDPIRGKPSRHRVLLFGVHQAIAGWIIGCYSMGFNHDEPTKSG